MGWVIVGIVGLVVVWVAASGRRLTRFYSREHFIEIADGLRGIREEVDRELKAGFLPSKNGDRPPPGFRTTRGLSIAWSAWKTDDGIHHHLSQASSEVAWAANGTLLAFVFDRLNFSSENADIFAMQSPIIHAEVVLTPDEHERFMSREIEDPPEAGFKDYFASLMTTMRRRGPPRRITPTGGTAPEAR